MKNSKVQNEGRIYYVEPNDYNNLPNGIPHPYEDYCISVDFTVEFGDRNSCGAVGYNEGSARSEKLSFSSDRGTINFIGGTNGFLTTNFTDVESMNPAKNTNECLGIESINITYTSWYIPEVNIRFVDVRGASLMAPQEQAYLETLQNEINNGKTTSTAIDGGSFFKALFSFPYPMFKLKVKGFYGKEVTYNLSVEKFEANFNSETGNFEVDAKFIGYMFGVYTDIPMNLLLVAPYVDGDSTETSGVKYWDNRGFKYLDNKNNILTYPELRKKIAGANPDKKTGTVESNSDEELNKLMREANGMRELSAYLDKFLGEVFDVGHFFIQVEYAKPQNGQQFGYYLCGLSTNSAITFSEISKSAAASNAVEGALLWLGEKTGIVTEKTKTAEGKKYDELIQEIVKYNTTYGTGNDLPFSTKLNHFNIKQVCKVEVMKGSSSGTGGQQTNEEVIKAINDEIKDNDNQILNVPVSIYGGETCIDMGAEIYNRYINTGKITKDTYIYMTPHTAWKPSGVTYVSHATSLPEWLCKINEYAYEKEKEVRGAEAQKQKELVVKIPQSIGFNPTIGNAFRMAFAHMDTFISIFNGYLSQIHARKNDGSRTLDKLGINKENTDLPSNFSSKNSVPPFTMFYKETNGEGEGSDNSTNKNGKKKTPLWPGKLPGDTSGLVEISFVNALIDAAVAYAERNKEEIDQTTNTDADSGSKNFLPLTNYDLLYGSVNPYSYLESVANGNNVWEIMLLTLLLRAYYWYCTRKPSDDEKKLCNFAGEVEAENLYIAYQKILPALKVGFKNFEKKPDEFVEMLITYFTTPKKGKEPRKVFDAGSGYDKNGVFSEEGGVNLTYQWIDKGEGPKYPVANGNPLKIDVTDKRSCILIGDKTNEKVVDVIETMATNDETELSIGLSNLASKRSLDGKKYCDTLSGLDKVNKYLYTIALENNASYAGVVDNKTGTEAQANVYSSAIYGEYTPIKDNSKNYYIYCPSYVNIATDTEENYYQLYGHPLFYGQNEIEDSNRRLMAKAFLFCAGIPARLIECNNKNMYSGAMLLWEGALWYEFLYRRDRNEQLLNLPNSFKKAQIVAGSGEDVEVVNETYLVNLDKVLEGTNFETGYASGGTQHKKNEIVSFIPTTAQKQKYSSMSKLLALRSAVERKKLADIFEKWANENFASINRDLELRGTVGTGQTAYTPTESYANFKKFVDSAVITNTDDKKKKDWVKYKTFFCGTGLSSEKYYDFDKYITCDNKSALHLTAKRVNEVQQKLINELVKKQYIIVHTDTVTAFQPKAPIKEFLKAFFNKITDKNHYATQIAADSDIPLPKVNGSDSDTNEDLKMATYMTLKNLYDRWLCMNRSLNRWKLGKTKEENPENSEFTHFKYIDSFYHNIEDKLNVNTESIIEIASQMMATSNISNTATNMKYQGLSFFDFLSQICQKNEMLFLTLPMENEFTNPKGIADLFDVQPYSRMDNRDTSCYVCLYTQRASQFLDVDWNNPEYMYATDGFNIANATGRIFKKDMMIPQLGDVDSDDYAIPAFGVTMAKQNQSIFKKISVNMQNPQVTEASIAATQLIAAKGSESSNQTAFYGQDLYRIYANYSYTCVVEMMGNAQIMPLTYFQLNNIPLFRGVYLIIKIEHSIRAGDMVTKFTGVRMSKYDMPLVTDEAIVINGRRGFGGAGGSGLIDSAAFDAFYDNFQAGEMLANSQLRNIGNFKKSSAMDAYNKDHPNDKVDNEPEHATRPISGDAIVENLKGLITRLAELETAWNAYCQQNIGEDWARYDRFYINSGYRSIMQNGEGTCVNKLAGSKVENSPHSFGIAADIAACDKKFTKNKSISDRLFEFLVQYHKKKGMHWGQIIYEQQGESSKWVHYGYKSTSGGYSDSILTFKDGVYTTIE